VHNVDIGSKKLITMGVSYKKQWKLLIDRDMKKTGISPSYIAKEGRNENFNKEVLVKSVLLCIAI